MTVLKFVDRLLLIARALETDGIPYAFGGAIALNYYQEPRATTDLDINIFLTESECRPALLALQKAGVPVRLERAEALIRRDAQTRIMWDGTPVDLFFQSVPLLAESATRTRRALFEGEEIAILSPEDLAICKVSFNRPKDWLDLREMFTYQRGRLDIGYMDRWLNEMLGPDDPAVVRYRALLRSTSRRRAARRPRTTRE